ncbi:MAG: DUF3368 domain-containing protein [Bacteroidota bacterium]|nr:DUF3368 domain-containing protein [Bacteroidota bacterium]
MSKIIVSDTSCLILLEKLNLLFVLKELFEEIAITPEIEKEYGQQLPEWIKVVDVQNKVYQVILQSIVDLGEASAIALAIEKQNCLLILDDNKARKAATRLGVPYIGTLGLLVGAKEAGLIQLVKPILEQIKTTNFRIEESLEKKILKLAGE